MKITFLVDLLCLVIFGLEAIIKTKRRGLLVEGGYLRSRSACFSNMIIRTSSLNLWFASIIGFIRWGQFDVVMLLFIGLSVVTHRQDTCSVSV